MRMHARIATFEGVGSEQAEALERLGREQFLPQMQQWPGYAGTLMLHEPDAEKGVDVEFFETEETMEAGHRELDAMSPPDELAGIRRTSVEKYEVVTHDVRGTPAAARATRTEGPLDKMEEGIRYAQEEVLPKAAQLDGWAGVVFLADRSSGKSVVITLWDTAEARKASEDASNQLRNEAAEAGDETILSIERFEVVAHEVPVRATR
jgi:heme-degrading monooxygenase HmoA